MATVKINVFEWNIIGLKLSQDINQNLMATQVNLTLTFSEVYFLSKNAWFTFIGNVKHHLIKHIIFNPYNLSFIFETFAL